MATFRCLGGTASPGHGHTALDTALDTAGMGICCGLAGALLTWLHPCHVPAEATFLSSFAHGESEAHSGQDPRAGSWGSKELKTQRPGGPRACHARSCHAWPPLCRARAPCPPGRAGGGQAALFPSGNSSSWGPSSPQGARRGSPWPPPRQQPGEPSLPLPHSTSDLPGGPGLRGGGVVAPLWTWDSRLLIPRLHCTLSPASTYQTAKSLGFLFL